MLEPQAPLSEQLHRVTAETFIASVEWHDELPSTNDRALALSAEQSLDLPLLIGAARQTAGRGRGTNRWWAGGGALTYSLLCQLEEERLPSARWPQISLAVGLAVAETLRNLLPQGDIKLKWPNDVMLGGRKVCGILVEAPAAAGRVVIGIGLNVNNSLSEAEPEVRERAVALCEVAGRPLPLIDVLVPLLQEIESQLARLSEPDPQLAERWRPLCLLRGRRVTLLSPRETSEGICQGIDADGALLLLTQDGLRRYISGTVEKV